ncbi:RNA methyltransferase [Bacteriovoracaceae bacterium]|nr:RNA methyltransferase [Bacteriovoracaceae bacterium]
MKNNFYLALVHSPIRNKNSEEVTTSVTNMDIHDISRSCRTFGVKKYFIVTPLQKQVELVQRILSHWKGDVANNYNPDRFEAMSIIELSPSVEKVAEQIEQAEGKKPIIAVTGANFEKFKGQVPDLTKFSQDEDRPILLLFGTGWGLHQKVLDLADYSLEPIFAAKNADGYNHLSVRSAVAIYLDRITNIR